VRYVGLLMKKLLNGAKNAGIFYLSLTRHLNTLPAKIVVHKISLLQSVVTSVVMYYKIQLAKLLPALSAPQEINLGQNIVLNVDLI